MAQLGVFSIEELIMWSLIDGEIFEEILDLHYIIKTGLLTLEELHNLKPLYPAAVTATGSQMSSSGHNSWMAAGNSGYSASAASTGHSYSSSSSSSSSSGGGNSAMYNGTVAGGSGVVAKSKWAGAVTAAPKPNGAPKPVGKMKVDKPPGPNGANGKAVKVFVPMVAQCPLCLEQVSGTRFAPHLEKCMNGGKRTSLGIRKYDGLYGDDWHTRREKMVFTDPYPNSAIVRVKLKNGMPRPNQVREGVSIEEWNTSQPGNGFSVA